MQGTEGSAGKAQNGESRGRQILSTLLFCGIGILLFFAVQKLLTPKYSWPKHTENIKYTIDGFRNLEENSQEVIFLGTSHMVYGIAPMEMYRDYQIVSYDLATSIQTVEGSYFLLKQVFKTQSPKVVVLDLSGVFFNDESRRNMDAGVHYIMDAYPLSADKVEFAANYQKLYERVKDNETVRVNAGVAAENVFWTSLFPLIKYHDRWNEMNETDFTGYFPLKNYYSAGQCVCSVVKPGAATVESLNETMEEMREAGVYEVELQEENLVYVERIKELCDAHGCSLLLTKIPSIISPAVYSSSWTTDRAAVARKIAEDLGVPYVDLTYDTDLGLDMTLDTQDGGMHLNHRGAVKTAKFFGKYLAENYGVGGRPNQQYEENLALYEEIADLAALQSEQDLCTYLEKLKAGEDRYLILMTAQNDMQQGLSEAEKEALHAFGLTQEYGPDFYMNSYIAVIDRGQVVTEQSSMDVLDYNMTLEDGTKISMNSRGYLANAASWTTVNGEDYGCHRIGLNIVVLDAETHLLLDSVAFDTYRPVHEVTRVAELIFNALREYENTKLFGFERKK